MAAVAAAVIAAAAAPTFTPPAAFIAPATPTKRALNATVGFISILWACKIKFLMTHKRAEAQLCGIQVVKDEYLSTPYN